MKPGRGEPLAPGARPLRGAVARGEWRRYFLTVPRGQGAGLRFRVVAEGGGGEDAGPLALYVRRAEPPELLDHDQACLPNHACASHDSSELVVDLKQADGASCWVGVYGKEGGNAFSILAESTETACPKGCSGQGQCVHGKCYCSQGSKGADCSESADNHVKLNSGTNLEKGYIGPRHFRYYYINSERRMKFIVASLTSVDGRAEEEGGADGLKVVVQRTQPPRARDFATYEHVADAAGLEDAQGNHTLRIRDPGAFSWWIGVYGGERGGNYQLYAKGAYPCPRSCEQHGICDEETSVCYCRQGYSGKDCAFPRVDPVRLTEPAQQLDSVPGSVLQQTADEALLHSQRPSYVWIGGDQWNFHTVKMAASAGEELRVEVMEQRTEGAGGGNATTDALRLYLQVGEKPSTSSFLAKSPASEKGVALVSSSSPGQEAEVVWSVGVLNTALEPLGYALNVQVVKSSCPNACQGQGQCHKGRCSCFKGYTGIDCGDLKMTDYQELTTGNPLDLELSPAKWEFIKVDLVRNVSFASVHFKLLEEKDPGAEIPEESRHRMCPSLRPLLNRNGPPALVDSATWAKRENKSVCLYQVAVDAAATHLSSFWCAVKWTGGHNVLGASLFTVPAESGNAQGKAKFLAYVNATYACPRDCSGKGQCEQGKCVCDNGFAGEDCGTELPQLLGLEDEGNIPVEVSPGHVVAGTVGVEKMPEHVVVYPAGDVDVEGTGMIWGMFGLLIMLVLYMRFWNVPGTDGGPEKPVYPDPRNTAFGGSAFAGSRVRGSRDQLATMDHNREGDWNHKIAVHPYHAAPLSPAVVTKGMGVARTGSMPSRYQSTGNMAALAPPPYRTTSGDILSMRHRRVMSQDTFHSPPDPGSRVPSNHATPEDNAVAVSISMV